MLGVGEPDLVPRDEPAGVVGGVEAAEGVEGARVVDSPEQVRVDQVCPY